MATEFTAASGAKIVINPAPWKDAKELKKAIQHGLAAANISLDSNKDIAAIFMQVDGSDEFDAALRPCLERCLRNGEKVIDRTFDDVEARKDYYEIAIACVKENLGPLVESLFSQFAALAAKMVVQKSNSQE